MVKRALAVSLAALAGCGGGDEQRGAEGRAREVGATVDAFESALARGDHTRICNELLSAEARVAAGGEECPVRLRDRTRGLRGARLEIERIDVTGNSATVRVTASAAGQPPAAETLKLLRQNGRFRVASLE